jgi:hypothetical protein
VYLSLIHTAFQHLKPVDINICHTSRYSRVVDGPPPESQFAKNSSLHVHTSKFTEHLLDGLEIL